MPHKYWLFKSEPETFSIDHLKSCPDGVSGWEGVRNYQARNMLRDEIKIGDEVLFYHSNARPSGIAGICRVVKNGYPDKTAFDPNSEYYDPKASPDNPRWYRVDVQFVSKLAEVIPLAVLKETPGLEKMMVTQKGSRLSIQPVKPDEWKIIKKLMRDYK
ncbi:MAG: EVE domain-containing protein [Candidatus Zixiibacteriota bacterium]